MSRDRPARWPRPKRKPRPRRRLNRGNEPRAESGSGRRKFLWTAAVALGTAAVVRVVKGWNAPAKPEVARLRLETKAGQDIESLAFSPDENWVATAGRQQLVRVLDTRTGAERVAIWFNRETRLMEFSPDGNVVAVLGDDQAVLIDAATGKVVRGLAGFVERSTQDTVFSPDPATLMSELLE